MKKTILILLLSIFVISCNNKKVVKDSIVYDVEFDVDYNNIGTDPLVCVGGVAFGNESVVRACRVENKHG